MFIILHYKYDIIDWYHIHDSSVVIFTAATTNIYLMWPSSKLRSLEELISTAAVGAKEC
jgi:hypothetical protein